MRLLNTNVVMKRVTGSEKSTDFIWNQKQKEKDAILVPSLSCCVFRVVWIYEDYAVFPMLSTFTIVGKPKEESDGFTLTQWAICISVVTIVIVVVIVTGIICHRKCHSNADGGSDTRSDDPTVVTSVSENDQYHLRQYPFGDLPDLPSSTGRMPNIPPDLLNGAVGPAIPTDQASGYSHQNRINDKKEGIPPPLYDPDETDLSAIDAKPPPYSP